MNKAILAAGVLPEDELLLQTSMTTTTLSPDPRMKWLSYREVCQGRCVEESIAGCLEKWVLQRRHVLP